MNPDAATLDEIRDWLARAEGWKWEAGESSSGVAFEIRLDYWLPPCEREWAWARDGKRTPHPFPLTLDGAAAAMPEGWNWQVDNLGFDNETEGKYRAIAWDDAYERYLHTDGTTEVEARYRLAAKARLAMEKNT